MCVFIWYVISDWTSDSCVSKLTDNEMGDQTSTVPSFVTSCKE